MRRMIVLTLTLCASLIVSPMLGRQSSADEQYPTVDGSFSGTGVIPAHGTVSLNVAGRGGVPSNGVGSVVVNVTVTNPTAASFLTVYPADEPLPTTANLVFVAGQTSPNMVIVKLGSGGRINLYNYGGNVDVIVDVQGWFPSGPAFTGLTPARLMDTRAGYPTIDGRFAGGGDVGPVSATDLTVLGRGGVPTSGVGAVALNVTAVDPTRDSYLTVYPAGVDRPTAANLNVVAGQRIPNMVIAKIGAGGAISVFNFAGKVDVVVDVLGWFPENGSFVGLTPVRVLETRVGLPTIDGLNQGLGAIGANTSITLDVLGRAGVPSSGVGAVAINVAVTNPTEASFLTVYPGVAPRPTAANLNFVAGQTVANLVIVKLGTWLDGTVSLYNLAGRVDVVVDLLGWFPDTGGYIGLVPARLMDSRRSAPPPTTPTSAPPVTTPPTTPAVASFGPGTYSVNSQIPAGRYVMRDARSGCFVSSAGQQIVTILASDVGFRSNSKCGTWVLTT